VRPWPVPEFNAERDRRHLPYRSGRLYYLQVRVAAGGENQFFDAGPNERIPVSVRGAPP
jgi:hypothetical protein